MANEANTENDDMPRNVLKQHPFRKAIIGGLAVVMPPLLTIVLFLWAWNIIETYVLVPVESSAKYAWILCQPSPILKEVPDGALDINRTVDGEVIDFKTKNGTFITYKHWYIPETIYKTVQGNPGEQEPLTGAAYYARYIQVAKLPRVKVIPIFLMVFVLILYFVGKLLAAGVGKILISYAEGIIRQLPLIRNVYSSVKQVTDFAFSQAELEYTRVVAVQYPREGIWSMGFVTGESMVDIHTAANEPVLSVLMPTSPMPATGFTVTVPKSETIDLNITIDQAIQFCVSCGVVVPHQQQYQSAIEADSKSPQAIQEMIRTAVSDNSGDSPALTDASPSSPTSEKESAESDENSVDA